MGEYYKNRRRCHISKKRIVILGLILSFTLSILEIIIIDKRLNLLLKNYIDIEVDKTMSHIVSRSMKRLKNEKMDSLLVITRNNNRIEKISYDTSSMLNIKNKIIENIEKELNDIEKISHEYYSSPNQEKSKNKFKNWKNGYICEVNINAIQGSTLFGNIGPSIPIKLSYMGYTYVDIDMDVEEYGINNVIVRINAIIKISNLITMPISTKVHEVVIKEPLSIEIINGDIPNYLIAGNK